LNTQDIQVIQCGAAVNLRADVFKLLEKNPLLSTKHICEILHIPYNKFKGHIWTYRYQWKTEQQKQTGSKCQLPAFHKPSAWVYIDNLGLKVSDAIEKGWVQTKSPNKYLIFRSPGVGHMKWFPSTGRVNIHTVKPHLKGRLLQLFCNGFSMNGLIDSVQILNSALLRIRFKGAHAVFGTPEKLPYMEIKLFKLSNGVTIRLGDRSHPNAVEIEYCYPDWAEKNEMLLGELYGFLRGKPEEPKKLEDGKDKGFYVS